jgi:hypothetical protein
MTAIGRRAVIALMAGVVVSAGLPSALASSSDVDMRGGVSPGVTVNPAEVDWGTRTSVALELGEAVVLLLGHEALVAGQDEMYVVDIDTMSVERRISGSGLAPSTVLGGKAYGATRTGLGYYDASKGAVTKNDNLCGSAGRARDAAAIDGLVYLSCDSAVVEVDPETLNALRRVDLGGWLGRVAIAGNYMFVPSYFNGLYKVDMRSFTQAGGPVCFNSYACGEHWRTYTNGASVLSVGLHRVFRYDTTGAYLGSNPTPVESYGSYFSTASEHGVLTSGTTEGVVTLFDWQTGSAIWSRDLGPGTSGIAASGSSVFMFSRDGQFTRYGNVIDAPSNVLASPSGSAVLVSWQGLVSDGGPSVTGYTVTSSLEGRSCSTTVGVDPNPLMCEIGGLVPGVTYVFTVVAHTTAGVSARSGQSNAITLPGAGINMRGRIASAGDVTCVIEDDDSVTCWGNDRHGNRTVTDAGSMSGARFLDVGFESACIVNEVSKVLCWGQNSMGQGSVPQDLPPALEVSVGWDVSCALLINRSVRCWGSDTAGLLSSAYPGSDVVEVSAGDGMVCLLRINGTVVCWGLEDRATRVSGAANVVGATQLASGRAVSCTRLFGGSLNCWGFADGRFAGYEALTDVAAVAVGSSVCALSTVGSVSCAGGYITNPPAGLPKSIEVSVGDAHACAVGSDGKVRCWGANESGQATPPPGLELSILRILNVTPGDGSLSVNWSRLSHVAGMPTTGYSLTATPGDAECSTDVGIDADPLTCTLTGLTNGSRYTLTLTATSDADTATAATQLATPRTVPGAPTGVVAAGSDGAAAVSWVAPTETGGAPISGYQVTGTPSGSCTTRVSDPDPLSCTVTGLTNGQSYTFGVVATNAAGDSAESSSTGAVMPMTAPSAPRTVTGIPGSGQVQVSWLAPSTLNGSTLTGYRVTASPGGASCSTSVTDTTPLSCAVSDLANGTGYTFRVVALAGLVQSPASAASSTVTPRTVPGVPSGVSAEPGGGQASVSWLAPASNGGSSVTGYVVTPVPSAGSCSVSGLSALCTGLVNGTDYTFTVVARNAAGDSLPSAASSPIVPRTVPEPPRTVTGAAASPSSVEVYWESPAFNGGAPVTGYSVVASPGGGVCSTSGAQTCTVSGLSKGQTYTFSVTATNPAGTSAASSPSAGVLVSAVPAEVAGVTQEARTFATVALSWAEPESYGLPVSSYRLRVSSDGGETWASSVEVPGRSFTLSGLPLAAARLVQVSAVNSKGQGPWSSSLLVTSKGAKETRVRVVTSDGRPVSGGAITWEMVPRTAWSVVTYGLTADGVIDFPSAPAGTVRVTLSSGQLPDGTLVSGTWTSTLGFDTTVLRLPAAPTAVRRVFVSLPGGLPVSNVQVQLSASMSATYRTSGFTFTRTTGNLSGFTDAAGQFTATGFPSGAVSAEVTYNDGVIGQSQFVELTSADTYVELEYAPFVRSDARSGVAAAGAAVQVGLTATNPGAGLRAYSSADGRVSMMAGRPGVRVRLVPPPGAPAGSCGARLSGVTGPTGKVSLRVCAMKSGTVRIRSTGAVPVGSFTLLVKGKPALPPTSLSARSTAVGQVSLSWARPVYNGGAAVTAYRVTLTRSGAAPVVRTLPVTATTELMMAVTGLSHAKRYTVRVQAITKYGVSDATTTTVPVA